MRDVKQLSELLETLEDRMAACMQCGMCQAVCPLYRESGLEMDVARGKIALVRNLAREILDEPRAVKTRLERCLLCGSCAAGCPSGVDVMEIFVRSRMIISGYLGLSAFKKAVFRGILSRPGVFDFSLRAAAGMQGIFAKTADSEMGTFCSRIPAKALKERHFPALARVPWHKRVRAPDPGGENAVHKIAFYPGCLTDKVFPEVAESCANVFKKYNYGIYMPANPACCGIPALSSGDIKSFKRLVRHNLDLYAGGDFDRLITPCATCTSTIRKTWPMLADLFSSQERERIFSLANKTLDITEFLADKISFGSKEEKRAENRVVTYHDPCHLKKSLGIENQPREILRAASGYVFREMPGAESCCGMGGSFNLEHYSLSRRIGERKLKNILAVNPDCVATACPACMIQLMDVISRAGHTIKVRHVVQVYDRYSWDG
jgi:glycolate oxidase iron-sulfur subunit